MVLYIIVHSCNFGCFSTTALCTFVIFFLTRINNIYGCCFSAPCVFPFFLDSIHSSVNSSKFILVPNNICHFVESSDKSCILVLPFSHTWYYSTVLNDLDEYCLVCTFCSKFTANSFFCCPFFRYIYWFNPVVLFSILYSILSRIR